MNHLEIGIEHLPVSGIQQPVHLPNRIQRILAFAVGVLLRQQVGLEDRLQDQRRRRHAPGHQRDPFISEG
jgi:hypothetical protein